MWIATSLTPVFSVKYRQSAQKRQGRGRALLSLIELFEQDFDLFEMEPASYDQIVANLGKSGLQQVCSNGGGLMMAVLVLIFHCLKQNISLRSVDKCLRRRRK